MPERTVKGVSLIVRDYFDEIKRTKFIFDITKVEMETGDEWTVHCEVTNVFDEEPHRYVVRVEDETGEITDVSEFTK